MYRNPTSKKENYNPKLKVENNNTEKIVLQNIPEQMDRLPIRQPERDSLQPFVKKIYPPGPPEYHGVEPNIEGSEVPEYATPDPGAEWVPQQERYVDWNGNNISYKLPRFRKPGHSGPLIKGSRTHYLRYPSIETRNSADIIPEEEFAMGGEYNLGDEIELTEAEVKRLRSLGYIIEEA
jgi:hypothetical protein